jgi:hypothetical protein
MQPSVLRHTFHGQDLAAAGLQHRNQATIHQQAVHDHGARAALAFAAAFFRTSQAQIFAQDIE